MGRGKWGDSVTIGSILLAIALFLLVGVYLFRPILAPPPRPTTPTQKEWLLAQKEGLLVQIRSLDLDYDTGKIATAHYEHERIQLKQAVADILRRIDQLSDERDAMDVQIEAAIAALHAQKHVDATCPNCATSVMVDDKFCRTCGDAL